MVNEEVRVNIGEFGAFIFNYRGREYFYNEFANHAPIRDYDFIMGNSILPDKYSEINKVIIIIDETFERRREQCI